MATAELKNALTGQGLEHAKKQYRTDRDPKNVTLARRAVQVRFGQSRSSQRHTRFDHTNTTPPTRGQIPHPDLPAVGRDPGDPLRGLEPE